MFNLNLKRKKAEKMSCFGFLLCWIRLTGGLPGSVSTAGCDSSDVCLRFLCWPQQFLVNNHPLPSQFPLKLHLQMSTAILGLGHKKEGGRERKQRHSTLCLFEGRCSPASHDHRNSLRKSASQLFQGVVTSAFPPVSWCQVFCCVHKHEGAGSTLNAGLSL